MRISMFPIILVQPVTIPTMLVKFSYPEYVVESAEGILATSGKHQPLACLVPKHRQCRDRR